MTDAKPTAEEALRAFNIAKSDPRSHPATVNRLWEAYVEAFEREAVKDSLDYRIFRDLFTFDHLPHGGLNMVQIIEDYIKKNGPA